MDGIWDIIAPALQTLLFRLIAVAIVAIATYIIVKALSKIVTYFLRGAEAEYLARIVETTKIAIYILAAIIIAAIIAPEVQVFTVIIFLMGLALIVMFADAIRNLGSEFFIRTRGIIKKGDWIEIEGISIRVLELGSIGIIGETPRLERVFVPYSRIINNIVINRTTPLGLALRVYVLVPTSYSIEMVRNSLYKAVEKIKEDLATEPDITYIGTKEDKLNFVIDMHIWNYRKVNKIVEELNKSIMELLPDAIMKT
ncbi:MscS Mechanosensitive ion channel [Ignisphaera aggregans DSM 17230]|uniref:MscS Mechanosensitive ion channel n=1 Tax=Ignisphaera aggregans (strain DSM 17230 / JCM 13409 / AQ1.S1) TaxID=583356 RepID=E0SSK5_IGNAA|nr:MscS Mechanosensitive ion channel [Ignisphaera aggregans DSM 17230]